MLFPLSVCQFLSRWAVGRNACSILLPLLWPSRWDAIVEPCPQYAGKMGAATYLWFMVWPPSPLTRRLEKKSWFPSLSSWYGLYVMILALMELSKFLQATTSPFPGFQGDLEIRAWLGRQIWNEILAPLFNRCVILGKNQQTKGTNLFKLVLTFLK